MANPEWPPALPNLLVAGYSESAPKLSLRTTMDAGPAKARRRFTAGVRPIKGKLLLTALQVEVLWDFWMNLCASGATPFAWVTNTLPAPGQPVQMRFTGEPSFSAVAPNLYEASLALEVLP